MMTSVMITARWCSDASGVVSLRGLRMMLFLAELNGVESWVTDISNAYLKVETKEKICIKAGPEFGGREGHMLIIHNDKLVKDCERHFGVEPTQKVWSPLKKGDHP